ncbi:MAG: hypothetical protein ACREDR_04085 [Blastocatellia bacterium]
MANYDEQVTRLWDDWIAETGKDSGDPGEFTDWAYASGKLTPRPQDIKHVLRKQITQVLRRAKRYDEDGHFTYRAKQSVTLFENGVATKHYFDTDEGGTQTLRQKSTRQRREAIANDVYRAVCDVERMNKIFPDEPQLNLFPDFTDDVAERRAADIADDEDDDGEEIA